MGRGIPKGVKKVDRVPTLAQDEAARASQKRTHKTFDEDEDIDVDEDYNEDFDQKGLVESSDDEEDAPEEIVASSDHIQSLKDQYEKSLSNNKKAQKKKRSVRSVQKLDEDEEEEDDDLLDSDLLQAVIDNQNVGDSDEHSDGEEKTFTIEINPKKRTIGRLQVEALEEKKLNPLEHFKLAPEIAAFERKRDQGVERVRYTTFISQRQIAPAKKFCK